MRQTRFPNKCNQLCETPCSIILEKTQILGEMGVIDTASRMATARAIEDCTLVFVSRSEFDKKLENTDPVVRGVLAILSSRLRDVQRRR